MPNVTDELVDNLLTLRTYIRAVDIILISLCLDHAQSDLVIAIHVCHMGSL